jgi:3-phosphoshikimate 1-carboxyvinyltransferase
MDWKIKPASKGAGQIKVPPDKSISHRAVMFGSICSGKVRVNNFLFAEDCTRTLESFKAMGVQIEEKAGSLLIRGKGLKGLAPPREALYLGNSGTTMRIISGILAGQSFDAVLTGDESLSGRPMGRVIEPLLQMGAEIEAVEEGDHPPLKIRAKETPLTPIDYKTPVASAQVKSCILAAGLYADGTTSVTEPFQSRDHTERMLEYFSADIKRKGLRTEITGQKELVPKDLEVPGDVSSAAFFIAGALLVQGSNIVIQDVGLNHTRIGAINVLKRMGGNIEVLDVKNGAEPRGDLRVISSGLKRTTIEAEEIPLLIDEVPVIVVAAAAAEGETVIKGISELKVKETDRVKSMTENLSRMGVELAEKDGTLVVPGGKKRLNKARLDSFGDHRTAMSMAIAALISDGECLISDADCVNTSYPGFFKDLGTIFSIY